MLAWFHGSFNVFPAHAGMSHLLGKLILGVRCFPRSRRDDPVSGTVSQVTDVLGQKALSVDNGGEYELNSVYCILKKDQLDKAASLNKGDQVTVVGKNDGYNQINVTLKNCSISQ